VVPPPHNHKICSPMNHMTTLTATLLASHPLFRPVLDLEPHKKEPDAGDHFHVELASRWGKQREMAVGPSRAAEKH
jgi:hypothetical protein